MKFICPECGNDQVQIKAWINPNTNKIIDFQYEDKDPSSGWCEFCNDNIIPEIDESYNLLIVIKIQEGEFTHTHHCLYTTNCKNTDFAVQWYIAHYWGYGKLDKSNESWSWDNGVHSGRLYRYHILNDEEFAFLSKFM